MFYVDTHIHLQDYKTKDIKNVINNAMKNDVGCFVNASAYPTDWIKVEKLAALYKQLIPAFGIHPWYVDKAPLDWAANLEKMLIKVPKAWVGECGIDNIKNHDIEKQTELFKIQAKLANIYKRPLIIHAVKADNIFNQMFDLLPKKTIFHSFTGSIEWGRELQKRGFYLGLNFSIMHKKNGGEIVRLLDYDHVLLETDGPYQSGNKNDESFPENLWKLASFVAEKKNISLEKMRQILYQNWQRFLGE